MNTPNKFDYYELKKIISIDICNLNLLPKHNWKDKIIKNWKIGEDEAQERLEEFVHNELDGYKDGRNFPNRKNVSRLSPHIHWGEISPNTIWHRVWSLQQLNTNKLQTKFDKFSWDNNTSFLKAWKSGQTGYPIVDAGMRELWSTGYMHNRLRMIVGSFLVKNLLLHWHEGEKWFWDCLVDADLASNSAGWQWIAGCGADAAPYFRIFNPITQGLKFDPDGHYIRKFVPEISQLPNKYLFNPCEAPSDVLKKANINLGENYPKPIVDIKISRERALSAFAKLKLT